MRTFAELSAESQARYPMCADLWTWYHLGTHPYPRCASDWGRCLTYHFDRGVPIGPWLELDGRVRGWVESRADLRQVIAFVPYYEIGFDFFAQCKPPYDGGYTTTHYEEFLEYGNCEPAPWFYEDIAELHRRVAEAVRLAPRSPEGRLLRKVVHATFVRPYEHLFWQDEYGWAVYQPNITGDDVREWMSLSGS